MVLLSCRATPLRRWLFVNISVYAFSLSMLLLCVLIVLELFTYNTLKSAHIIELLDTNMPVINRKAIVVAILCCVVLLIQMLSINIIRGQNVVRLRAELKTVTDKFFFMCLAAAIMLFSGVLCIVYANRFKSALAAGLLQTIVTYDDKPEDRSFVDRLQSFYNCCGVNGDDDYRDLSSVKLYGHKNYLAREKTLKACSKDDSVCLFPLSCCFSVECTEYSLSEFDIDSSQFYERWYKSEGCVSSLLSSVFGLVDPSLPIWLLFTAFVVEFVGLLFAQLTLTSYVTLAESGLSEADESVAWLLPFSYPSPEDIVQHLMDWAADLYIEDDSEQNRNDLKKKAKVNVPLSAPSSPSGSRKKLSEKASDEKGNLPKK